MAQDFLAVGLWFGPALYNQGERLPHEHVPGGGYLLDPSVSVAFVPYTGPDARTTTEAWRDVRDFLTPGGYLGPSLLGAPGYEHAVPGYWSLTASAWPAPEAPPTLPSTTYTRLLSETLVLSDAAKEFWNEARLRRVTDTLRVTDARAWTRLRWRSARDTITFIDSQNTGGYTAYVGLGRLDAIAYSEYLIDRQYDATAMLYLSGFYSYWRSYGFDGLGRLDASAPARYRQVELTIVGVPAGYSARITLPDSTVAVQNVSTMGRVVLEMDVPDTVTSGTLEIFTDGAAYATPAPYGMIPVNSPGLGEFHRGNIWRYARTPYWLTATAQSLYIERPAGGWTDNGSGRVEREEFGFVTFTESALLGLSRGSHDTTATSHTGIVSLQVAGLWTGSTWLDITSYLANVNSVKYLQDSYPILANSFDELYIGANSKFSAAHLWLARNASERLLIHPAFSIATATWGSLLSSHFVQPTDLTSGLTWSGMVGIEPPGNWAPACMRSDSEMLGDGTPRYYLRLIRLSETLSTPPCLMDVTLTADTVVTRRIGSPFLYTPTLQDSGQLLFFKAIAYGMSGAMADGPSAPVTVLDRS